MNDSTFHLAPNAPWPWLALLSLAALALAWWAYRIAIPPLPSLARRALPALRALALIVLLWLLAQPVIERVAGGAVRLVALVDRSRSMSIVERAGEQPRSERAAHALAALRAAWRGRADVEVRGFAAHLESDSNRVGSTGVTALGDALEQLGRDPQGERASGVVVISDGAVNAGADPVAAARELGLPVHTVRIGRDVEADRAVTSVEGSTRARVGEATPVRVRVTSSEPRGTPIGLTLRDGGRVLARATVIAPGPGAEAAAELRATPDHAGLAVWTARLDPLNGDGSTANDARQMAIDVAPGRIGVLIVSSGLNWDLGFLRRALQGDSSLALVTRVRDRAGWRALERGDRGGAPGERELRAAAVVVLDAIEPATVSPGFDRALATFVKSGGGLLVLGGPPPGITRVRSGALAPEFAFRFESEPAIGPANPVLQPEARELLQWDDDATRGDQAWRAAAPLVDPAPVEPAAGDRLLISAGPHGPPLLFTRRIGSGQALFVNGGGVWRWSLNAHDDLSEERGRRLWRRMVRWLAEPVQVEPLRVRPERWLVAGDEPVRLFATLQDDAFRPVAGAAVEGEVRAASGATRVVRFEPRAAGAYVAELDDLPAGRYSVRARATRSGRPLGQATSEFAVDAWSLETARVAPDSATLVAIADASGGRSSGEAQVGRWARSLETRALARPRRESVRLWESPWLFALVVALLATEWAWRRRRGLP